MFLVSRYLGLCIAINVKFSVPDVKVLIKQKILTAQNTCMKIACKLSSRHIKGIIGSKQSNRFCENYSI